MRMCAHAAMANRDRLVGTSWACAYAQCRQCDRVWVAVYPMDVEWPLQCPRCRVHAGELKQGAR